MAAFSCTIYLPTQNGHANLGNSYEIYRDYGDWHGKNAAQMMFETEEYEIIPDYATVKTTEEEVMAKLEEIAQMPNGPYTDKVLREYLQSLGFDSITYENSFEDVDDEDRLNGFNGDNSYIVFDPNQVKSADPVTYDDNGNIIPLSERFNRCDYHR